MKRTLSQSQWIVITIFLVPCLVRPSGTLSIRVETDPSYGSSLRNPHSPFGSRYSGELDPIQEEEKTDSKSYEYVDSDEAGVTEQYLESATRPVPSIPPALRRHFARLTATTQEPEIVDERKPIKTKSKRRRKVKRRPTKKSTTPKAADEDLGIQENSKNNSTGEKNLALEINSDDGKYALINVFFDHNNKSKPPGVLSYLQSEDFSKDNDRTLGNLQQNDIWLSEGHLLILKGGDFDTNSKDRWKPIDSYERKKPSLKIPLDTNNPPPFPVFVNESGPPVFLGPPPPFGPFMPPDFGSNETFDPSRLPPPGLIPLYPNGTIPAFFGPPSNFGGNHSFPPPFPFRRPGPQQEGVYGGVNGPPNGGLYGGGGPPGPGYAYGGNAPPNTFNDSSIPPGLFFPAGPNNNSRLPPPPFYPFGPPGERNPNFPPPGPNGGFPFLPPLVLNPNDNETDDPSIFLPPPYDFDYYEDNSTIVPPGPFAPGLVVPPPKGFYTVYNRTTPSYSSSPTIPTIIAFSDARSQRPNGKKPKFPITNPPDDSLEAAYPITTPYSTFTTTYIKKRKRPGKTGKVFLNPLLTKYSKGDSTSEEISAEVPEEPPNEYKPVILIPQPFVTTTSTSTTPKPPNYVYVRGQLKTLAEIAAEQAIEDGFIQKSTPRAPYDELGYPSRNVEDNNQPIAFDFPRKTTPKTKLYYQNTPKYTANYNPNVYIKKQDKYPTAYPTTLARPYNQGEQNLIQPSQRPIIFQDPNVPVSNIRNNNNNDRSVYYPDNYTRQKAGIRGPTYFNPASTTNNGQSQEQPQRTAYTPDNYTRQKAGIRGPTYFNPASTTNNGQSQEQPQRTAYTPNNQLQLYNQNHRQPHQSQVNQNQGDSVQGNEQPLAQRTNSGFRPAFGPSQQQRSRAQVLFPGPTNQPALPYNPIYQLPQNQGYYSPITQYRQPLDQNLNNPNSFYPSQPHNPNPGSDYNNNGQVPQYFQPQQFYPHNPQQFQQQTQPSFNYNPQQQYLQQQQQQQHPLHRDILVNYREPLPQYNTESEAITVRPVAKAGPGPLQSQYGSDPTGAGSTTTAVQTAGSFYSFQRGGPGGFSYKIRL